jgi:predicted metalloprotease with PDZ domain
LASAALARLDRHRSDRLSLVALSTFAAMPTAQVAGRADALARRHLTARGVLYATALAARLRATGKGSRALDPILRDLFLRVRAEHRPLTLTDWLAAAGSHAGAAAENEYQRIVEAGQLPVFAAGGLGPCFQLVRRRYVEFELGFDLENSRGRPEGILGLTAHGPAARAGLRPTDHLMSAHYMEGDPSIMTVLDVERSGKRITLQYRPVGRRVEGPAWARRNDVPEAACLLQ